MFWMSWFGPDVTIHEERSSLEILWDGISCLLLWAFTTKEFACVPSLVFYVIL